MTTITLDHIHKRIGGKTLLDGLDLEIASGEFLVLLGESGSGKSTTLRLIAGLDALSGGRIRFDGTEVSGRSTRPANRRDLGFVFQNFALWPQMTARENTAYPLRARRIPKAEALARAQDALELVRLGDLGDRYPHELSGGQQQRVNLARALSARPRVILFDEPLSSLDATLRQDLRDEIGRLHADLGFTAVYVTHDRQEALTLADRIALLHQGRLEQIGGVEALMARPASRAVARLLGFDHFQPAEVLARRSPGEVLARIGGEAPGFTLPLNSGDPGNGDLAPGTRAEIGWRSVDVFGRPAAGPAQPHQIPVDLLALRRSGLTERIARVRAGGVEFDLRLPREFWSAAARAGLDALQLDGKTPAGPPILADFSVLPPVVIG